MTQPAAEPGFIRVDCQACRNPDVWFRCDACKKSDGFLMSEGVVTCTCNAQYDRGHCTCGQTVPAEHLLFVPFDKGPIALADLEIAWSRVGVVGAVVLAIIGLGAYWMLG